ncbi:MAG: bacteriohemerythrin, partial [gamma proteobacterium symbiont of Bathyaustriella thionipta]|nr:bacteriohemerythrin [gamma proteobacterium symbiont of Bathyaustriella thionipta]MCU7950988.1 bacteriohemerythrin [gamma proteobacterium symbiont of Bathyaustriella thionipta]MCU7951805.1 bacteriohemerythrin [gamma proteobacterium symbiont of Bathyaustriella thionipta]MCU7957490.1 bacteriohemerythrin [gamma proteobacterium symbiont of Bathyaustriella thionipta]MCU7967332.1 bacteriohemerythrin [gamma proteobacterium symbiont of Bathyaustriella thionipta]
MKSFQWDKHFITGLSEVDQQHKQLVDIINKFSDHLSKNELVYDDIESIFAELADYTQYHFDEEEEMMSSMGIDQRHLGNHIEGHQNFLQEVKSLHNHMSPENADSAKYLLEFLIHWLAYHILGTDQNMARQVEAIQTGVSPQAAYDEQERSRDSSTAPLLAALKGLFNQVSSRNKELLQLNESLEEKVAERTRELSEANRHFEELALTDVLTGLPNRRHAMRQLSVLWDESLVSKTPLVCMMIDADHFKEVNDTYGHDAGDEVLCELSKTLQHAVRTDDIVSRLGGDEFFIICPSTNLEGGMYLAELIRKNVSELHVPTGDGGCRPSCDNGHPRPNYFFLNAITFSGSETS